MGYHRAGFEVTGVDKEPQPRFPFAFVQADALKYLREHGREYDAIHTSPPCQRFSSTASLHPDNVYPDPVGPTRVELEKIGHPWVIENVPGAPIRKDIVLCGTGFGLRVIRHRWFEVNWEAPVLVPPCNHWSPTAEWGRRGRRTGNLHTVCGHDGRIGEWREAMQIDWMDKGGLAQAIPPAYTEFIGRALLGWIGVKA